MVAFNGCLAVFLKKVTSSSHETMWAGSHTPLLFFLSTDPDSTQSASSGQNPSLLQNPPSTPLGFPSCKSFCLFSGCQSLTLIWWDCLIPSFIFSRSVSSTIWSALRGWGACLVPLYFRTVLCIIVAREVLDVTLLVFGSISQMQ